MNYSTLVMISMSQAFQKESVSRPMPITLFYWITQQRNRSFYTAFMECNNECWNGTCNWFWRKSLYSCKIYSTRQWCSWRSFDVILTVIRIKIQECTIWMFQDVLHQNVSELQLLASTYHFCCLFRLFYYLRCNWIKFLNWYSYFSQSRDYIFEFPRFWTMWACSRNENLRSKIKPVDLTRVLGNLSCLIFCDRELLLVQIMNWAARNEWRITRWYYVNFCSRDCTQPFCIYISRHQ